MNHTYYFMAGLPRAGATLLKSNIDQNPEIYAGPVSPVIELMYYNQYYFHTSESYDGDPRPKSAFNLIKCIPDNYHFDIKKPIIIEHNRAWVNYIERIKAYITPNPKIICTVRDVLEVLTSFITMIHRNSDQVSFIDEELIQKNIPVNDDTRCDFLMDFETGIVGQALFAQEQAFIRREDKEHLLLVEYNDLVDKTEETMRRLYEFLELDYYPHHFDNIKNNNREVEKQWGMKDMHEVRSTIKRVSKRPEEVLSDYVLNKYSNLEYWKVSSGKYY